MWAFGGGAIRPSDQPESNEDESATFFGVPAPTTLYGPQLRAGRWLEPSDTYAVVLNQKLAEEAGVRVGDWITLSQKLYGESKLIYNYTPTGAIYWLGIVTMLSILASWLPARSAARVSVRESLAYQ